MFRSYVGDHAPVHVHVFRKGREIGRWDIEHQCPLDSFPLTHRLIRALREAGSICMRGGVVTGKSERPGMYEGRLCDVVFVPSMSALVVKFLSGRVYAVPLTDLEGTDPTMVTRVSLGSDGYAAVIEQESGNRLEVPWDVVLYHAEPGYRFYKYGGDAADSAAGRQQIGERIHLERANRHWTLADLSLRTGIKVPNLSRLEKGRHVPSLETLEKVAGAFDLPVAELVSYRRAAGVVR